MSVRRAMVALVSETSIGCVSRAVGSILSVMQGTYRERHAPSTADRHLLAGPSSLQPVLRDLALLEQREGCVDDESADHGGDDEQAVELRAEVRETREPSGPRDLARKPTADSCAGVCDEPFVRRLRL
jgi:hypothetical protein